MWIGNYQRALKLARRGENFDALIAAAVLRADTHNFATLTVAFPELVADVQRRYDAPGGALTLDEWVASHGDPDPDTRRWLAERFSRSAA